MPKKLSSRTGSSQNPGKGEESRQAEDGYEEELAASCYVVETFVKRSRFIACAAPAPSVSDAFAFIAAASETDARHNCWAFRVGSDVTRSSDDGEPSGTAGKPILGAIDHSGLSYVVVVVVRYFGGIKLGAPGLTRAYSNAASTCLKEAPRQQRLVTSDIRVQVPQHCVGSALAILDVYKVIDVVYG
jgi:putative IMPACT (imprinted ancient) family translation regulator